MKKSKEKKNPLNCRICNESNRILTLLINETGFTKTYIIEKLICEERIVLITQGREIAKNLFLILKELDKNRPDQIEILERLDYLCTLLSAVLQ